MTRYIVSRIIKMLNLQSRQYRIHRYKKTGTEKRLIPNRLNRNFNVQKPNAVWCGDVTYVWTKEGWSYIAAVIDFFSRKVIGNAFSKSPDSALTQQALKMAFESRGRPKNLLFHSD